MASGGARARSGPAPDPNALRRDRPSDGEWETLPAEGRLGDPPAWPLLGQTEREAELWIVMWAKPQAIIWERNGQEIEVALYVRNLTYVENPESSVTAGTLLRQQADSLGVTVPGMRSHRWKIAAKPQERSTGPVADVVPISTSTRTRLKAVPRGEGGA